MTELSEDECFKRVAEYMDIVNQNLKVERDMIEIKKSTVYDSNGLFAKTFIPEGELIVHYPPNIVSFGEHIYTCKDLYKHLDQKDVEELAERCDDYRVCVNIGDKPVWVWADPQFKNNANFIGHMINDRGYKQKKIYKPELNNCRFNGLDIISTKDIKAGEELGLTYGSGYWYTSYNNKPSRNVRIKNKIYL